MNSVPQQPRRSDRYVYGTENRMDVIERLLAGVREMPCYFKAA